MKYEISLSVLIVFLLTMVKVFGNEIRSAIEIEDTIKKVWQIILVFKNWHFDFFEAYHLNIMTLY